MPEPSEIAITLDLLQIGYCTGPLSMTRKGAPWRKGRFPAGIALLRHSQFGSILFDTGYGAAFWQATAPFPERLYRWLTPAYLDDQASLPRQLAQLGCERPDLIFLSHLHADHVAGLFDLVQLPAIFASQQALDGLGKSRLATLRAGCPRGLRDHLKALAIQPLQARPIADLTPYGLADFGEGHDLLGDGSLLAVPLPGHGIGQTGLYLPSTTRGPFFLVADAIWSLDALEDNCPPPDMTLRNLGKRDDYLRTFSRLREFHRNRPEVGIIASHCPRSYPEPPVMA